MCYWLERCTIVAPDLFKVGSVLPLIDSAPETVLEIIKMHKLANEMSNLICGRTTHPITLIPGGFSSVPSEKQLKELKKKLGVSILLITHDMGVIAEVCDRVSVMYAGFILESSDVFSLFARPRHPYTRGLIQSIPSLK